MSVSSIGVSYSAFATWPPTKPVGRTAGDPEGTFEAAAAATASSSSIPSAYDKSWMTKNLSTQDKATITATTGVTFGAAGSVLVPMSASPNDSYALQKTMHLLNSQRGSFPKDLTPEELLRLIKHNAPGSDPEPISDLTARLHARRDTSSTHVAVRG